MGRRNMFFLAAAVLLVLLSIMLGGCSGAMDASVGRIAAPPIQAPPLEGKWEVLRELGTQDGGSKPASQWKHSSVQFGGGSALIDGRVWNDLSYKIKRVNAADYMAAKYIPETDYTAEDSGMAEIITVYAADNYLGEFMKTDGGKMLFLSQNVSYVLNKISDRADPMPGGSDTNSEEQNPAQGGGSSGVLLGLKTPGEEGYSYQTLWIAADHYRVHPILSSKNLFFPRTSGFWELKVLNQEAGGNFLTARNISSRKPESLQGEKEFAQLNSADRAAITIDYIGNDYAAIERNAEGISRMQILPVDNLTSTAAIKISDLLGEKGLDSYRAARAEEMSRLKESGAGLIDGDASADSFGLLRKNGHWLLVGRINYQLGGEAAIKDFELKSIPPSNLIFYDSLALSWHNVRDRVPDAMDAFTSPGRDIALVKTKNKLTIYSVGAEHLNEDPLAELNLKEGTEVIMAEWALESYVGSWEESFLSYGAQALPAGSVHMR